MLMDVEQLGPKLREGLAHLSRHGKESVGDYLEFGVFQGTSMICMWDALKEMDLGHVRMFGFDSFEDMPEVASTDDDGHWKPGEFAAPYELTKERLAQAGVPENQAVLIKGWLSDTLNKETIACHDISNAGVIMIDVDIYTSLQAGARLLRSADLTRSGARHGRLVRGRRELRRAQQGSAAGAEETPSREPALPDD